MKYCLQLTLQEIEKHTIKTVFYQQGEKNEKNTVIVGDVSKSGTDEEISDYFNNKIEVWKKTKGRRYEQVAS